MLSKSDQRRIMQADNLRRRQRDAAELEAFAQAIEATKAQQYPHKRGTHINPELVRGASVVSPPSKPRHTLRGAGRAGSGHWYDVSVQDAHKPAILLRQLGTRGVATGTENGSDYTPTVLVTHADGSSEIRTVDSFSKHSTRTRSKGATAVAAPHMKSCADMAPIGDMNH